MGKRALGRVWSFQRRRKAVAGIRKSSSLLPLAKPVCIVQCKTHRSPSFSSHFCFSALCHGQRRLIMGMLVEGVWKDVWYDTKSTGGHFKRSEAAFRNWVTADGAPGPSGTGGFKPQRRDGYHLYVSLACPWAHRT
jgi:hypothetical protein